MKNIRPNETRVIRLLKGKHREVIQTFKLSNGREVMGLKYHVPTDQGLFQLPKMAYRCLMNEMMKVVERGLDPYGPWIGFEVRRGGEGINTQYAVKALCLPAIAACMIDDPIAPRATSSSVDPNYMAPPAPRPTAPMPRPSFADDEAFGWPATLSPEPVRYTNAFKCRCDIKNLLSTGHDKGCPEKKP